ncbi:hypothetical protein CROQUDRAFT_658461 [Cronartium quercuum f. sp. fusiforme G11]|uniref:Cyclic nucleotide-binding domain-containing protein n=1 Tax=Cronartium quercuum f. sp. fusiforme G11 TaxID=708437 RepID=A0A9P6NGH5_9BASI|nr:hypothetical protein CROQUDRAFT_658461 [Cronartium quercuum f. sp. fusiforme G11]
MSLPSAYNTLLNELNRDILRSAPTDPLQFCASWFFQKLEQERIRARAALAGSPNPISPQPSVVSYIPTAEPVYSHPVAYSALPPSNGYTPHLVHPQATYSPQLAPSFHPQHPQNHIPPQSYSNPFQQPQQPYLAPVYHASSDRAYPPPPQPAYDVSPPATTNGYRPHGPPPHSAEQRPYSFGRPSSRHQNHHHQRIGPTDDHDRHHPPPRSPTHAHHHHHHHPPHPHHPHSQPGSRVVSTSSQRRPPTDSSTHEVSPRAAPAIPAPPTTTASAQPACRAPSDEEEEGEASDDEPPMVPAGYNFGRRTSVSAESLSPSNLALGNALPKVVIPKTEEQRKRIEVSIRDNLLFRNLDEEQYSDVLNAMAEVRVSNGQEVIVQGAVGDFFYVVEEGTFDVYVRGPATYTYVPPLPNQPHGTLSGLGENGEESGVGAPGTAVSHQAPPKKVHSYGPGGSFGELALMYNAPRAATVVATSTSATLWALDRVTFRSILMEHTSRKRKMYEAFLSEVPILASLTPVERSKIADSLEERTINEGVAVVKEGEVGREFYIIESGRAEVEKTREGGGIEVVGVLGKGDHFGELALLNSAPRAATVRVAAGSGRLRVAALGEKAFTRLLGPVIDILSRHAESHYGASAVVRRGETPKQPRPAPPPSSSENGPFGNWAGLGNGPSGSNSNSNGHRSARESAGPTGESE